MTDGRTSFNHTMSTLNVRTLKGEEMLKVELGRALNKIKLNIFGRFEGGGEV